jgi:hypothetical protein
MDMTEPYKIENIPLFASLPSAEVASLNDAATRRLYRAGEIIFSHNEVPEHL